MPNKVTSFSSRRAGTGNKAQRKSSTVVLSVLCVLFVLCLMTQIWLFGHISLKDYNKPKANCPSTMDGPGVPTFKHRDDLGDIAKLEGFTKGLELGVQRAYYSNAMLTRNPTWSEYHCTCCPQLICFFPFTRAVQYFLFQWLMCGRR